MSISQWVTILWFLKKGEGTLEPDKKDLVWSPAERRMYSMGVRALTSSPD